MSKAYKTIILVFILILTIVWTAGCGAAQPPATIQAVPETPAPATEQPTQTPTASPAPYTPTATSEATPTATEVSPTLTAESHAPVILDLVDQTIPDGERFPNVDLDEHVADADHAVDEITWHISGDAELKTRSLGRSLIVSTPGGEWIGSEILRFEACDPDGLCDAVDVVYTVVDENDAPVIAIDDQVILPGEIFGTIVLDEHVRDVDNPDDEITWSYSGNAELEVNITDGVLTVDVPDGQWQGSETIRFQACDPEGVCDAADVLFWVMEKSDAKVEITYIGNEGFLIAAGDKKILVDALFQTSPPSPTLSPAVVELMQNARPPFDDVDLVLATHSHHDHFHAGMVWQHLQNNPQALFVSTREAVDLLPWDSEAADELRERIIPIQLRARERRQLAVNGIGLEIVYLSHGEDAPDNLGFIITVEGHRLFHMGDISGEHVTASYLQAYHLLDKNVEVVFVPYHLLSEEQYHPLVLEGMQAQYIIPMHWPIAGEGVVDTIHDYFPDAIFFNEELEIWAMPTASLPLAPNPNALRITILYDNTSYDKRLTADWGFSALVEYGEHTILFDTGDNGEILKRNIETLGVELESVDVIVLSHIHHDHTGGLDEILELGITPPVYVPIAFPEEFKKRMQARTDLVSVLAPVEILPGIYSTGQLGSRIPEQGLVLATQEGSVVIVGCAHPGIVHMVRESKKLVEGDVVLVMGGFHLSAISEYRVEGIIRDLRELGVQRVAPCHCTGEMAIQMFAAACGESYIKGGAGRVITLETVLLPRQ